LIQMWSNNYLEGTLIPSSYLKISKESSFLWSATHTCG
jgi:hypothetical protein